MPDWAGWGIDEIGGARVGKVHGFFADAGSGDPIWLIASLEARGFSLRRRRPRLVAVPMGDCAGGGHRVWTAHEGEAIRSAPLVDPDRPLLREHELTICSHYGIGEKVGRAAVVVERPGDAVTSQPA